MISIYSKPNCPQCDMAKKLAAMKGLEYGVLVLDEDYTLEELKERFAEKLPRSFPVVVEDGTLIGGLNELKLRIARG